MKKKAYQSPAMNMVEIEAAQMMATSNLTSVSTNMSDNDDISYGGGSTDAARVKTNAVDWDDWDE